MSGSKSENNINTTLPLDELTDAALRPAAPGRRYDVVYAILRDHITRSIFEPGLVLTESAIARSFNVSRSPAAAALARLAADGLVSDFAGRGFLVGPQTNVPVRRDLAKSGLNLTNASLADLQQRGWRDRLYPLVEREVAASMAFGPFRIVGATLADTFGVSRTIAHEVLTRLERVGLVEQASNGHWHVPQLTKQDLEEHYQIRYLLEPIALIEGGAGMAPNEIRIRLDRARALFKRGTALSEAEIGLLENDLHRDIVLACKSRQLRLNIQRSQLPLIATHLSFERYLNGDEILVTIAQHELILERLGVGDEIGAMNAMRTHLEVACSATLACLKAGLPAPSARLPVYLASA